MQNKQKYILSVFIFLFVLSIGLFLYWMEPKENTQKSIDAHQVSKTSAQSVAPIVPVQTNGVQSGVSHSGSAQTGTSNQKLVFQKPNTEWKTRTRSGITYVFGEGNPKEVALGQSDFRKIMQRCASESPMSPYVQKLFTNGICTNDGLFRYVTPELEYALQSALSDPGWEKLFSECRSALTYLGPATDGLTFDIVFSRDFLDIERWMMIDPDTGWKQIVYPFTLITFLERGMSEYGPGESIMNPYGGCTEKYANPIIEKLNRVANQYEPPIQFPH